MTVVRFFCLLVLSSQLACADVMRPKARESIGDRYTETTNGQYPLLADGGLCGVADLGGKALHPISGRLPGCSVDAPVSVTSVAGVTLSQPATMDCTTARALRSWVIDGVQGALAGYGGGARKLSVAAHYSCRTRNNRPGAKLSEHAKGHAIDISGLTLANGEKISLLSDWNAGVKGQYLRAMHRAACGPFGTVLGPDADQYHQDHFHFDTARYRSGSYCR